MLLHKAYYNSPIGVAEVTANDRAILSVNLVDQPADDSLMDEGKVGLPVTPQPEVLSQCLRELDEYFRGERQQFSVKLEREGTEFQKNVWRALETIPFGKTFSYADIAVAVGSPKAVRAVGLANSKNPHWVVVPCHRVIGKSGKLVGYAGGLDRKKWLLDHEKQYQ